MITCILLSAGLSQRFGSPKALAKRNTETVIEHLQKLLIKSQVNEIIIVLGAHAEQIKPHILKHNKVRFVYNKNYNFGQTSSFKAGLECISKNVTGVMLFPVDHPLIQLETINSLGQNFLNNKPLILVPTFKGKKGHPPLFSISLRDQFLALENNKGLNTIMHAHQTETTTMPFEDPGIIKSFNTQEEFESLNLPN